jgi:hypothetical protein
VLFFVFFYLFPDGRFVPLWTRWLAAVWVAREIARYFFPDSPFSPWSWPPLLTLLEALVSAGTCIFAQIYRYTRVSGPVERQQTKWVIFGMTLAVVGFFVFAVPNVFLSTSSRIGSSYYLISLAVMYLSFLLIPLSLIVAILRYRLWEIDVLINRTLVYSILTVTLALVYLGSIVLLQQGFRTFAGQENQLAVVASTLAIASLFNPLRHRLQEFIDRRFYRRKYDAAKTLEAFNAKLRNETSLATLSNHVLTVVNETMQPTHVSLWLPPSQEVTSEDKALSEEAQ